MKPYLALCLTALSLLGTVLSGPMSSRRDYGNVPLNYDAYPSYAESYADAQQGGPQEGEIKLPAKDVEEMKRQMIQKPLELAETQLRHTVTTRDVMHGSTVVIRYDKNSYLRCPPRGLGYCSRSTCPGMCMQGNDWGRCGENVFRIYHKNGPGAIRVGDYVALYFPTARKWFSMYTNRGHLQIHCPGVPNVNYGFHRADSWFHCGAEVFRIHSYGKLDGQIIENQDYITLYYPAGRQYLRLDTVIPILTTCPGKIYPPSPTAYDACVGEVFQIELQ